MGHPGAGKSITVSFWRDGAAGALCGDGLCAGHDVDIANLDEMLIPAFEARGSIFDPVTGQGTGLDIRGVAHALSVNEDRIIMHAAEALSVPGTSGTDFFYMTAGDQALSGGNGADFYFVGGPSTGSGPSNDGIRDQDSGGDDELNLLISTASAANDNELWLRASV